MSFRPVCPVRGFRGHVVLGALIAASMAEAQRPAVVRLGAENDAFSFWLPPWERTDREYTSGVLGALEYAGPSRVLARLPWRAPDCAPRSCRVQTSTYAVGQAIYTGDLHVPTDAPPAPRVGARPNAGWLHLEAVATDSTARETTEWRLALGVVGPPALGGPMQRLFHSLGSEYQREAPDWSAQLPFEPGFVVRYARTRPLRTVGEPDGWIADVAARGEGAIGTILTGATFGLGGRIALPPGPARRRRTVPRVALGARARGHLIIRDEFLDGTFFRSSPRVKRNPVYGDHQLSLDLRWPGIAVRYAANRAGRQYRTQAIPSSWGSIAVEWRPK